MIEDYSSTFWGFLVPWFKLRAFEHGLGFQRILEPMFRM